VEFTSKKLERIIEKGNGKNGVSFSRYGNTVVKSRAYLV